MSFTYVIPDIHGRDDLLSRALERDIVRMRAVPPVSSSLIGDYVNKGPQTRQVIERLLPGIGGGWRFVALKGNHDAMMVEGLRDPAKFWPFGWIEAAIRRWRPMVAIPRPCRTPISRGSTNCG